MSGLWIVALVVGGIFLATCLNGFFRNFWDQRVKREMAKLQRADGMRLSALNEISVHTEKVQQLSALINAHREQVELIENGITPRGFKAGEDLYNQADEQLYAGYDMVFSEVTVDSTNDSIQVVPGPPVPPIPTAGTEEGPVHGR